MKYVTDDPHGILENSMNLVFDKGNVVFVRDDGVHEGPVALTDWVKRQCILHGCDEFDAETPEAIIGEVCSCGEEYGDCLVYQAYNFAVQAAALRMRLRSYEDRLGYFFERTD